MDYRSELLCFRRRKKPHTNKRLYKKRENAMKTPCSRETRRKKSCCVYVKVNVYVYRWIMYVCTIIINVGCVCAPPRRQETAEERRNLHSINYSCRMSSNKSTDQTAAQTRDPVTDPEKEWVCASSLNEETNHFVQDISFAYANVVVRSVCCALCVVPFRELMTKRLSSAT